MPAASRRVPEGCAVTGLESLFGARPELPPMPERIARLPLDHRGYPVPWFVAWVDGEGNPVSPGEGTADFRVIAPDRISDAVTFSQCWICGQRTGANVAYVIGPMCAVNRVSSEPPSHRDCAIFAAIACPFLTRPHAKRREAGLPEDALDPAGFALKRNPGVALVWVTRGVKTFPVPGGYLFDAGDPTETLWFAEGREAQHAPEVEASIASGLPALQEMADAEGPVATAKLQRMYERSLTYLSVIA